MSRTQIRSQQRRRRVLDAAMTIFSRDGYSDAGMDDIARESETSKGGLYFHFPSKQSLFDALLDEASETLISRVELAMESEPDLVAKGDAALKSVLDTFGRHRTIARILLVDGLGAGPEFNKKMADLHSRFADVIKAYLDESIEVGVFAPHDTAIASVAWFGAVNQVVTRWVLTGEPERLIDAYPQLRSLLLYGLVGQAGERET